MKYLYIIIIAALFVACGSEDKEIETPVITGESVTVIDSYPTFTGDRSGKSGFYASNGAVNGQRPFNVLSSDWTWEVWVKLEDGTVLDTDVLYSSIIMEQRYVFTMYAIPANEDKPMETRTKTVIDYTQPNGVGEEQYTVKAEYDLVYSKLHNSGSGGDAEIVSMTTFDKEAVVLAFDDWVHIAITRSSDDNMARLFINGNLVDESDDDLWISKSSVSAPNWGNAYRGGYVSQTKCAMRKVRVSTTARYMEGFTPDLTKDFVVDDETLFLLNMIEDERVDPADESPEMQTQGTYPKNVFFSDVKWDQEVKMTLNY